MFTILDEKTGKELYANFDGECVEGQIAIPELRTEHLDNVYFDFKTRKFYGDKPIEENEVN